MKLLTAKLSLFLLFILLAGCRSTDALPNGRGRILLWHSWTAAEADTMAGILQKFNEIHPNVTVISQAIPPENLYQQYEQAARLGLGPDVFIGPSEWLVPLADQGLILDVQPFEPQTEDYFSRAIGTMTYKDGLYGLPLALRPAALYFNTTQVSTPAANLDEWLAQAADGRTIAMDANFLPAFWGIQAFGGRVFDETGRVVLDEGGFTNWLLWLQNAQSAPGMVLSRDSASLRELFFSGKAAYYTGTPDDLAAAREALGTDNVSVVPLPSGPVGPSGPLLDLEAIYFNPASHAQQTESALLLASYLTNSNQATTLLRDLSRVPANRTVQVDRRLHPAEAGFAAQARTAVAVSNLPQKNMVVSQGDNLYRAVLAGAADVLAATNTLVNEVNSAHGFAAVTAPPRICQTEGVLRIWHPWNGRLAAALEKFVADYQANCPNVRILVTEIPEDELLDLFTASGASSSSLPDLLLGSSAWLLPLIEAQTIQPITNDIAAETRQRFIPAALNTLEYQSELYGLPYWLDFNVLYFNRTQISDPPLTLDELAQQAQSAGIALPVSFIETYWGATTFGSQLFSEDFRLTLVETGFVDWLTWLSDLQAESLVLLDDNPARLQVAFTNGETAMLVGPTSVLGVLEQTMDNANLGVAQLPAGPGGEARPWLQTTAFFMKADSFPDQQALALSFAEFATNAANQTYLMEQTRLVPVNVNVSAENAPIISSLLRRVNSAFTPPNVAELTAVLTYGDEVYQELLAGEKSPLAIACDFTISVDRANGFAVETTDLPALCQDQSP
ncbi:MAG: extracellular solute-binding protein [Chloroflexi bacterium]|nr:extracellular solute-binding protein [Chloroflexota bacterium]